MATQQKFDKLEFRFTPKDYYLDDDYRAKVVKTLSNSETKAEAGEKLGISAGLVNAIAEVEEQGLIPFRNQNELQKKIVKARDKDGNGWGLIGARAGGLPERRVQRLYEEETGVSYTESVIGRGGRPKGTGSNGDGGAKKTASKSTKSKSTAKKGGAKKSTKKDARPFPNADADGGDDDEIQEAIEGATLTVERPGGKTAEVEVAEVQAFATNKSGQRGVKVLDIDEKSKTFAMNKVIAVN